jgi:hypothetical protein
MSIDPSGNNSLPPKNTVPLRRPWYLNGTWHFLLFNAAFAAAFFGPLRDLAQTSWRSQYYTYIPFIPFISSYLMFMDRQTIFSQRESSSAPGLLTAGIGILLLFVAGNHKISFDTDYLYITFLLITIWTGGFAFCYGIRAARAAAFPLLFLLFAVPIPNALLDGAIVFLQTGSAEISYRLLQATGMPIARDGFVLSSDARYRGREAVQRSARPRAGHYRVLAAYFFCAQGGRGHSDDITSSHRCPEKWCQDRHSLLAQRLLG